MNFFKIFLIFIFFVLINISFANQKNTDLEKKFRELSSELRCLVCQNQSLLESDSDLANDLKEIIHEKLNQGESKEQIKSFLVKRYGEFILFKPLFNKANSLLWLAPLLSFILIALVGIRKTTLKKKK
tara:strand:+ start:109 stop:492 length:384 start_codon:yes stop_codon:yes gene_type:complete